MINRGLQLTSILKEVMQQQTSAGQPEKQWTVEDKRAALAMISKLNEYAQQLRRQHNLMELGETLNKVTDAADAFIAGDASDSFDEVTRKRNIAELRKYSVEFNKLAREATTIEQRMEALFEDCGTILNRYFDIK